MIDPRICAHRGWTRDLMENTPAALRSAVEHGCKSVEFDVQELGDGTWVVYHDENLGRLHGVATLLSELDADGLSDYPDIATLQDVLPLFESGCVPMIEVKPKRPRSVDRLFEVIRPHCQQHETIVITHGADMTRLVVDELPDARTFYYETDWLRAAEDAPDGIAGYDLLGWGAPIEAEELEDLAARLGKDGREIAVWTINDVADATRWLDLGCRWVITDIPWEMPEA